MTRIPNTTNPRSPDLSGHDVLATVVTALILATAVGILAVLL
jgi:hypothetical protein